MRTKDAVITSTSKTHTTEDITNLLLDTINELFVVILLLW